MLLFKWQHNYSTMLVNSSSSSTSSATPNNGHINHEYNNDNQYLASTHSHDHLRVPSFYGPHSRSTPNVAIYCDSEVRIAWSFPTFPSGFKGDGDETPVGKQAICEKSSPQRMSVALFSSTRLTKIVSSLDCHRFLFCNEMFSIEEKRLRISLFASWTLFSQVRRQKRLSAFEKLIGNESERVPREQSKQSWSVWNTRRSGCRSLVIWLDCVTIVSDSCSFSSVHFM